MGKFPEYKNQTETVFCFDVRVHFFAELNYIYNRESHECVTMCAQKDPRGPAKWKILLAQKSVHPPDSTSNYIRGNRLGDEPTSAGDRMMTSKGLNVVTVLIGVFSMKSGQPVIGVINQPFAEYDREKKR